MGMRRQFFLTLSAGLLAAGLSVGQLSAASAAISTKVAGSDGWGRAIILHRASGAAGFGISAISCSSPGNCGAGGPSLSNGEQRAFVVSQVRGKWGPVLFIGNLATRKGWKPVASVSAVSCPSAGNCVAVGSYRNPSLLRQAFIVTQRHGRWGKATPVPGLARLVKGNDGLGAVSCPSAGNCSATGGYTSKSGQALPFVVSEVHGVWGRATNLPGLAALPGATGASGAGLGPISCPSAGNCSAAGGYPVAGGNQAFVISQVHGTWANPVAVAGLTSLNTGLEDGIGSISCPSPGNCGATGTYFTTDGGSEGFVVSQSHGAWSPAIIIPGTLTLNQGQSAEASAISCPSPGNCGVGGTDNEIEDGDATTAQVFVASEVNGTWHNAIQVPGVARLNKGDDAAFQSISCPTAGNCAAGGSYSPGGNRGFPSSAAFVVSQTHGTWSTALEVPGTSALNTAEGASLAAVSCPAPGKCSATGVVETNKIGFQTFVVSRS